MSVFQASLYDTSTQKISVTLDTECSIVTIEDKSNYSASTEVGHILADHFGAQSYRKIILKSPNGTEYSWDGRSSLYNDGDVVWSAPNSGQHTVTKTLTEDDGDGVFTATLISIPAFNDTVEYVYASGNEKHVFYLGKVYRNKQTVTGQITDTTKWEVVSDEDLSAKYKAEAKFTLTCRKLHKCYEELVHKANCVIVDDACNDNNLCENKDFLNATKLRLVLDGIAYASQASDFSKAEILTNAANKICC